MCHDTEGGWSLASWTSQNLALASARSVVCYAAIYRKMKS